jgi:hypothetical protein
MPSATKNIIIWHPTDERVYRLTSSQCPQLGVSGHSSVGYRSGIQGVTGAGSPRCWLRPQGRGSPPCWMTGWTCGSRFRLLALIFPVTYEGGKINRVFAVHAVRVYRDPADVAHRLSAFGTSVAELIPVIEQIIAARNDVVGVDARTAAGTQAWLAGVRHTRFLFMPKGWEPDWANGVESVVDPETGIKIVYQSVDQACIRFRGPQPINGKGPAAAGLVAFAQGGLFTEEELPEVAPAKIEALNESVWFLCVSADEDDVRVELSLPAAVMGGKFQGFLERIFIVSDGEWQRRERLEDAPEDDGAYEFSIVRK